MKSMFLSEKYTSYTKLTKNFTERCGYVKFLRRDRVNRESCSSFSLNVSV